MKLSILLEIAVIHSCTFASWNALIQKNCNYICGKMLVRVFFNKESDTIWCRDECQWINGDNQSSLFTNRNQIFNQIHTVDLSFTNHN